MTTGRPLRILLNATAALGGGSVTYWLNMLPALAELGLPHEYVVLLPRSQNRIEPTLPPNFRVERISFPRPVTLFRLVWEQTVLPLLLRRRGVDVLLAPADVVPLLAPCPVVMAIRNLNPYQGPKGSTMRERLRERVLMQLTRVSSVRATHVFFVSQDSRLIIAPALGLSLDKTSVVPHGISRTFGEEAAEDVRDGSEGSPRYILSVSAIRIHKNFETLLRAFAAILREPPDGRSRILVIAGVVTDPPYYARLQSLCRELGIVDAVRFIGEVRYAELPRLYRRAELFVQTSQAETFCHPLVEAMAAGVPVISSDLGAAREVCGDAVSYYPVGDSAALELRMRELLVTEGMRSQRISAGQARAAQFSWERTARRTIDLLEEAVSPLD